MKYDKFILLSRDKFRELVFNRDNNKCINCNLPAVDAHHIIERRLFSDGGYYLENGASLCSKCHILAETTELSCKEIRQKIGIKNFPIPDHLYKDQEYDKWGNLILPNGTRTRGELFNDISVQKILQPVMNVFTYKVKYPRTYHLPWSPGISKDDKVLTSLDSFKDKNVIVSIKYDGECTTLYNDYIHARSLTYESHESRSAIKALHASICNDIPVGWRICGENLYAKHSIHYSNLENHFKVFSIWNDKNICLSWNDTLDWCNLLNLTPVKVVYDGIFNRSIIEKLYTPYYDEDECEGYVVRISDSFSYSEFKTNVSKFVRKNHIQTSDHWIRESIKINGIKNDKKV